jgi:hypothetical protein
MPDSFHSGRGIRNLHVHPRQPLTSLFLWVDDGQPGSILKVRVADDSESEECWR